MKGYSVPLSPEGKAVLYGSLPHHHRGRALMVRFKGDEEALRSVVPEPLELEKDPVCRVSIYDLDNLELVGSREDGHFVNPERVRFHEATLVIPVTYKGQPGLYNPYLWADNDAAVAFNREVAGWPEKMAKVALSPVWDRKDLAAGTKLQGIVERYSERLITMSVEVVERATQSDWGLELPTTQKWFTLRVIPSPEEGVPPLKQLISWQVPSRIEDLWKGSAKLTFHESENEELLPLQPREIIAGFYLGSIEFDLGFGKVVNTY